MGNNMNMFKCGDGMLRNTFEAFFAFCDLKVSIKNYAK